jgi:hypothetical protein
MSVTQARQLAEVSANGAVIGVLAGAVVGGLAAVVGQPVGWALTGAVALGIPLAVLGATYGVLVALGRAKPGMFAPAALAWLVGFPHIKEHNPYAERVYASYVAHAEAVWAARERKRARRSGSTGAAARARTSRSS